eukprot:comp14548_c0_seq1/m.10778 comp14548_c0_seq1/g.10778  ORF comp14548_c0_seq1/g.10778 comp14548_c0_seq1/m.10778 type:complete len:936 (-) comp14548_c0_seq1:45-2852(-)
MADLPSTLRRDRRPGAKAVPQNVSGKSTLASVTDYILDVVPIRALPSALVQNLSSIKNPTKQDPASPLADKVTWVKFDTSDAVDGKKRNDDQRYLFIGYENGIQLWSISEPGDVHEILSLRDRQYHTAKLLPSPAKRSLIDGEEEDTVDDFADYRPLLALVPAGQEQHTVCLYSLRTHRVVYTLRFKTPVLSVLAGQRLVVAALSDHLYAFHPHTLENAFSVNGFRAPPGGRSCPVALGKRWLAYATDHPVPTRFKLAQGVGVEYGAGEENASAAAMAVAKDVAKDIASGLYYLGQTGVHTVSSYFSPTSSLQSINTPASSPAPPQKQAASQPPARDSKDGRIAGAVVVRDIETKALVAVFQAHQTHAVSNLAFDPTGTLLATASVQGHTFNVFHFAQRPPPRPSHLLPVHDDSSANNTPVIAPWHIYCLNRGVTSATVQDISFSQDSRWVAFSTTNGTTHVFAINPSGGVVTVETHTSLSLTNPNVYTSAGVDLHANPPPLITMQALARIKQYSVPTGDTQQQQPETGSPSIPLASFLCTPLALTTDAEGAGGGAQLQILLAGHRGLLTEYCMTPTLPIIGAQPTSRQTELHVTCEAVLEWDLLRGRDWPPVTAPLLPRTMLFEVEGSQTPSTIASRRRSSRSDIGSATTSSNSPASLSKTPPSHQGSLNQPPFPLPIGKFDAKWLSKVEIQTHAPPHRPLYKGPQFSFKVFPLLPNRMESSEYGGSDERTEGGPNEIAALWLDEAMLARSAEISSSEPIPLAESIALSGAYHIVAPQMGMSPPSPDLASTQQCLGSDINAAMATHFARHDSPSPPPAVPQPLRNLLDEDLDIFDQTFQTRYQPTGPTLPLPLLPSDRQKQPKPGGSEDDLQVVGLEEHIEPELDDVLDDFNEVGLPATDTSDDDLLEEYLTNLPRRPKTAATQRRGPAPRNTL